MPWRNFCFSAVILTAASPLAARAQTDEIRVYGAEIAERGHVDAALHNDYAPDGLRQPAFPGGTISNHSWNGALETADGMTDWWELGVYMPVYTFAPGTAQFNGGQIANPVRRAGCSAADVLLRAEFRAELQQQVLGG
nr:hypothetical protein [uncultured Rhodopila sp.]